MYINQQTKTTFQYLLDDLCKPIMTNLFKKMAHL